MSTPTDHDTFMARTVEWINRTMLSPSVTIDADTPLFTGGFINSIRVLRLIAWTEHALSLRIPDARIRMDYFQTVRRIADTFAAPCAEEGDADVAA